MIIAGVFAGNLVLNEKKGMLWSHVGGYLVSVAIILAGLVVLLKGELKTGPGGTDRPML